LVQTPSAVRELSSVEFTRFPAMNGRQKVAYGLFIGTEIRDIE